MTRARSGDRKYAPAWSKEETPWTRAWPWTRAYLWLVGGLVLVGLLGTVLHLIEWIVGSLQAD